MPSVASISFGILYTVVVATLQATVWNHFDSDSCTAVTLSDRSFRRIASLVQETHTASCENRQPIRAILDEIKEEETVAQASFGGAVERFGFSIASLSLSVIGLLVNRPRQGFRPQQQFRRPPPGALIPLN